jgi:predicted Zn finger-like uncharacterized protein
MYTQCPDCEIAFKVTADVLKQAAGMVRCGSCGHAFNALAYLSEQMPKQPRRHEASAALPELKPEIIDTDDGFPQSISAEQSAALLKTLDELAGSNIRIEDTGVEWRVLDELDASAPAADDDDAGDTFEPGITNVDEYLDDTETPIDEFLTATPEVVDAPEIFAAANNQGAKAAVEELRFDDNTPLPEDFDLDAAASLVASPEPKPQLSADDETEDDSAENAAADFALSEPDEWTDILGEFQDLATDLAAPPDVSIDDAADDASGDNEDLFVAPAAETVDPSDDVPLDMDAQFALQAEAMGIDLSGIEVIESDDDPEDQIYLDLDDESDDELDQLFVLDDDPETEDEFRLDDEFDFDDESDDQLQDEPEDELEEEIETADATRDAEFDREIEQLDLIVEQDEIIDEPIVEQHTIENELETALAEDDSAEALNPFYVPPMTEDEHTVNMMIDQDLMSLAIEDEDGFASTIVIPDKDAEKKLRADKAANTEPDLADDDEHSDEAQGFETIIMEGEFVRSAFDRKKLKADAATAAKLATIKRAGEAEKEGRKGGTRWGMVAGIVLLVLVLAAQAIHQSREALATLPAFSNTVGQVYRALGQPVQPAWDITGWRFEATKGSAEGENGELTIYSRLGNKSDGPLPYPLIGISLTDRFEETIGSRVLDPAEYLPTDLDPRKLVPPGNTFNAVITIDSTTANATGFKLNVCYRLSDGQLRCAIDDFK